MLILISESVLFYILNETIQFAVLLLFNSIAEFAHPAYEFMEIKKENEETVDITFNASPEKICQKDTYFAGDKASDFHL